ncbi:MAG TPA: DUF1697 domain-containing protein [Lapillicoccus sp.]|nr:DUF1697 domain-containing protein [Lapillicoccus sp.]
MTVRIGFLRAVNLGKRRVEMPRLKKTVEDLGYDDVWTYINSGNVVFDTTGSRANVEKALEKALEAEFGFECTTFVRTAAELEKSLAATPFEVAASDTHFITFLKKAPSASAAKGLEALSNDYDTLVVKGADVHWRMHGLSSDSTLQRRQWEKVLGPLSSTSRNVKALTKLSAKIASRTPEQ